MRLGRGCWNTRGPAARRPKALGRSPSWSVALAPSSSSARTVARVEARTHKEGRRRWLIWYGWPASMSASRRWKCTSCRRARAGRWLMTGAACLRRWLLDQGVAVVAVEATGGYERQISEALEEAGLVV